MSTATADAPVKVDPADLAHLDFEIACTHEDCEERAAWWLACRSCHAHEPLCDTHRRYDIDAAETSSPRTLIHCGLCSASAPARHWRRVFDWIPIGGAS